jgi:quercetin dioxygenase-like cupin family protein
MADRSSKLRTTTRKLGLAALGAMAIATFSDAGAANAARCPADKVIAHPAPGVPADAVTMPQGVADSVLASIDLAREAVHLEGRLFRLRRLVIEPGGIVPWHEHGNRPALIYIVEGQITEYANTCAEPVLHRAGEVAMESHGLGHWWRNTGDRTVVLLSADLFPAGHDPRAM